MAEVVDLQDERLEVRYGLSAYGGGRGVFTRVPIRVGTVVMAEEPVFVGPGHIEVGMAPTCSAAMDGAAWL